MGLGLGAPVIWVSAGWLGWMSVRRPSIGQEEGLATLEHSALVREYQKISRCGRVIVLVTLLSIAPPPPPQ